MLFIIIPVHNRIDETIKCIVSIHNQEFDDFLVIVVDDGSTDGTSEKINSKFPSVKILKGDGNLFWTGAVKIGIDYALNLSNDGDWLLLMNNDVSLKDKNIIDKLIKISRSNNRLALVSPLTHDIFTNKCIESGTIVKSWVLNRTIKINELSVRKVPNSEIEVDFMTARCLLHPIEIFNNIGNYDAKNFPHYGGDDEFSIRAKRYGYKCIVSKDIAVHLNNTRVENSLTKKWGSYMKFSLFSIRSSNNLKVKLKFALRVVPKNALLSYTLIAILKSIIYPIMIIINAEKS